jgi:hypothetical protein
MNVNERIEPVVRRCKACLAAREPGHFLVRTQVPAERPGMPPLHSFDLDRQLEEWMEKQLAAARPLWAATEGIDDDSIPSICPCFGIAEHSAFTGTPVRLQEGTCLPVPIVHDWSDMDKLRLSEDAPWYQYMKKGYQWLAAHKDGSFLLSVRGSEMPMDLANAIRGDQLFLDFLLEKEQTHRLMTWCTEAIRWYYPKLVSWADQIDGGNIFYYSGGWLGPRVLGHVSNDAAMLCSAQVYEEFGYPYEVRLMEDFGGLFYHVHTEKMHALPKTATLPRLMLMEMTPDPKSPPPVEDLKNIYTHTGQSALVIYATPEQIRRNVEQLKQRNVFLCARCQNHTEAQEIVRFVRKHSKPL